MGKNLHRTIKVQQQVKPSRHQLKGNEVLLYKEKIRNLTKEMQKLKAEKKHYQQLLHAASNLKSNKPQKTISLYVLRLKNDCWYIGYSKNVAKRFLKHMNGKGALWTLANQPIEIFEIRETGLTLDSEAAKLEDMLTIEYARMYGTENVRGGGYCQTKPRWPKELLA